MKRGWSSVKKQTKQNTITFFYVTIFLDTWQQTWQDASCIEYAPAQMGRFLRNNKKL